MKLMIGYVLAASAVVGLITAALLFTPLGHRPLETLLPVGDIEPVDFRSLVLSDKPSHYLVCPPDYCAAEAQATSSEFEVSANRLRQLWETVIASEPRLTLLTKQDDTQFDYVKRSARFRFPDIVTVRFIALSASRSTLAVYSRSVYGRSDFGANQKRVQAWLQKLCAAAAR